MAIEDFDSIEELLAHDKLKECLDSFIDKDLENARCIIISWTDKDDTRWYRTAGIARLSAVGLLTNSIMMLLAPDPGDELPADEAGDDLEDRDDTD